MDDNKSVEFKIVQKALNKDMMPEERLLSCSQAKKSVVVSMIYSGKRTVTGEIKLINTSFTKMLLLSMLLIHLALQLWLISVNLTVCILVYAHEHSIIHNPAARRRVAHCVPARVCALARCASAILGARRRNENRNARLRPAAGWFAE